MLNHIEIMGRLTRDPELRRTQSGTAVASFAVACERDFKSADGAKETDFIDCVAWRQTAEFVSRYLSKGRMAVVAGRLQLRKYEDKSGNKRTAAEVVAENVYFCDSPQNERRDGASAPYGERQAEVPPTYGGADGNLFSGRAVPPPIPYGGAQTTLPGVNASREFLPPASDFAMLEDDNSLMPF